MARVAAPAKVNLWLRVLGRRADGYHDLDTLFQAIDYVDDVVVRLSDAGVSLAVRGADVGPTEKNLAYLAAQRFASEFGYPGGIEIELVKRIPAGAGLGGGSSDAGAVLRCLAAVRGIESENPRLGAIAASLGSDVPFFLGESPLARGLGRGERVEALAPLPPAVLVLVSPPVHVSTAWAYGALAASRSARTGIGWNLGAVPVGWEEVAAAAANDFTRVVCAVHPEIQRAMGALLAAGASYALMSGSGSSVFGMFADAPGAAGAAEALHGELGWPCRSVRTLNRWPPVTVV